MQKLKEAHCKPCHGGMPSLNERRARLLLAEIPGWAIEQNTLIRTFNFKDYDETSPS